MINLSCYCCGAELTAPVRIDGKIYGYTCAAKIEGGKSKRKRKVVACKIVKDWRVSNGWVFATTVKTDCGRLLKLNRDNVGNIVKAFEIDGNLFTEIDR